MAGGSFRFVAFCVFVFWWPHSSGSVLCRYVTNPRGGPSSRGGWCAVKGRGDSVGLAVVDDVLECSRVEVGEGVGDTSVSFYEGVQLFCVGWVGDEVSNFVGFSVGVADSVADVGDHSRGVNDRRHFVFRCLVAVFCSVVVYGDMSPVCDEGERMESVVQGLGEL